MFCSQCGKKFSEKDKFCPDCGSAKTGETSGADAGGKKPESAKARKIFLAGAFATLALGGLFCVLGIRLVSQAGTSAQALDQRNLQYYVLLTYLFFAFSAGLFFRKSWRGIYKKGDESIKFSPGRRAIYSIIDLFLFFIFGSITYAISTQTDQMSVFPEINKALPTLYVLTFVFFLNFVLMAAGKAKKGIIKRFIPMALLFSAGVYFYNDELMDIFGIPKTAPILANAIFYSESDADPTSWDFKDEKGRTYFTLIYPGQYDVFVDPATDIAEVQKIIDPFGGKIMGQIPKIGYYYFETDPAKTGEVIGNMASNNKIIGGGPNFVLGTDTGDGNSNNIFSQEKPAGLPSLPGGGNMIDLSQKGKISEELFAPFLKSPDPASKVILVQMDTFVKQPEQRAHGDLVYETASKIIGQKAVNSVEIGNLPCFGDAPKLCSSSHRIINSLVATIVGAQMNGQKVIINMSWGVKPITTEEGMLDKKAKSGANAWGIPSWGMFHEEIFKTLDSLDWVKQGNVLLAKSAGNGVNYLDIKNQKGASYGMDVSQAIEKLLEKYPDLQNKVVFAGVKDSSGKTVQYSNFGSNVVFKELPPGSLGGTSFAAPQFWAELYDYWTKNPELKAGDVWADVQGLPRIETADGGETNPTEPTPAAAETKPTPTPTKPTAAAKCPGDLQVCGKSCIPKNAECCNDNTYCLKPAGSCSDQKHDCYYCDVGQKFCGMFCVPQAKECKIGGIGSSALLWCNGKTWTPCAASEKFYCPPSGEPTCEQKDSVFCAGKWWSPCGAGTRFVCEATEAHCEIVSGAQQSPTPTPASTSPITGNNEKVEISASVDSTNCEIVKQNVFYVERATRIPITEYTYRVTASGKATGPVGIMFGIGQDPLDSAYFNSETVGFDMASWTGHKSTRLSKMSYISRADGEPQTTSWTLDGGEYMIQDDPDMNPLINQPFSVVARLCIQGVNPCYLSTGPRVTCPK
jgi:hypothetical protein